MFCSVLLFWRAQRNFYIIFCYFLLFYRITNNNITTHEECSWNICCTGVTFPEKRSSVWYLKKKTIWTPFKTKLNCFERLCEKYIRSSSFTLLRFYDLKNPKKDQNNNNESTVCISEIIWMEWKVNCENYVFACLPFTICWSANIKIKRIFYSTMERAINL